MAEKKSPKEIRRQLVGKYRRQDCEIDETTSWSDGLNETSRFLPGLPRPLRRTDSCDDIQRYKLYFSLARKNQRNQLTWKNYCDILLDELHNSDIVISLKKMSIQPSCSSNTSDASNFPTVPRSVSSLKKMFENHTPKNNSPFADIDADVESLSSTDNVKSLFKNARRGKLPTQTPIKQEPSNSSKVATSSVKTLYDVRTSIKRPLVGIDTDVESVSSLDNVQFETPSKNILKLGTQTLCTPIKQEPSNSPEVATSVSSVKASYEIQTPIKRPLVDIDADVEGVSSLDDVRFHTPSKNVLKKMCTEIRTLAQKTCKTVERMTTTKYCTTCGDVMRSATLHRKCSKQRIEKNMCTTPASSGLFRSSNPVKRPMIFQSPTITTGSVYLVDPRFKKLQRKPFYRL